ncbi:MAG: lipoate--protein ligase family protein [Firmicutes bacterium]|nr:lipoate--protein ligase family protein [Bacillota bacterium]
MTGWRLIVSPPLSGTENMAIDEAIMIAVREEKVPPTVRFYRWQPPTLSIGAFQSVAREVDVDRCKALGVGFVRRPTGGRAVLHDDEVTYSFIVNESHPLIPPGVRESYQIAASAIVDGLVSMGVPAQMYARNDAAADRAARPGTGHAPACFDSSSWYEITVDDKKLVGSAQWREKGTLLQHGSILLSLDVDRLMEVLRFSSEERKAISRELLVSRTETISNVLGRPVSFDETVSALISGFSKRLDTRLEAEDLTDYEIDLARRLEAEKYGSREWLHRK